MKARAGQNLRRKQLDKLFGQPSMLNHGPPSQKGWIREIRQALGMSGVQLAQRLNVTPQTIVDMEHSEEAGTISIRTLRRAAEAMGLKLVYTFVPPQSLEAIVRARANEVATRFYADVDRNMALEGQGADEKGKREQIAELADELVRNLSRDLWEGNDGPASPRRGDAS